MKTTFIRSLIVLTLVSIISACSTSDHCCRDSNKSSTPRIYLNVYWVPKSIKTLYPWGIDDIKSSYYQIISRRSFHNRQDNVVALTERIKSLPQDKRRDDIEPRLINHRLYFELFHYDELVFEVGTGISSDLVVINGVVWEDDSEFYERNILEIIERD